MSSDPLRHWYNSYFFLRKIRQSIQSLFEENRILPVLTLLRENLWPEGKLRVPLQPRTAEEKLRSRDEANRKLSALVPGSMTPTVKNES